jgi:TonB family protein
MGIRPWLSFALLCAALPLNATSLRPWQRDDVLENPRYVSENGRYVLVVREYPAVGDFASVRADKVIDFDAPGHEFQLLRDDDPETEGGALYEGRRLLSVLKVAQDHSGLLVSDSGDRIITTGTSSWSWPIETLLRIYDARGTLIRSVAMLDAFTPTDVQTMHFAPFDPPLDISLQMDSKEGEILAVAVGKVATVRIRTADGTLVDPRRDLLPAARVYASAAREPAPLARFDPSPDDACFANVARIASPQLLARAVERPMPPFPEVARKARIRGRVWAEVVVSESGDVVCARATRLPFGLQQAALAAARQWKFTPYELGGHRVPVTSEILFHFVDLEPQQWEELQKHPPY